MKSQVMSAWNIPWLPTFALILFVTVFMIMLYIVFKKNSGDAYNKISRIPLTEGEDDE
jgi:cbb3-type cytochrome oxidase subunit 3